MVFVNFRVGDTEYAAVAIDDRLCRVFGADVVFRSSRAMHGGAIFPATLSAKAAGCAVMIAVIGPGWLAERGGARRIDAPDDWVRREIELALENGRTVIPVLTGDRPRLGPLDKLPGSVAGLIDRQYLRFHHRSAERDLAHLVDEVRHHIDLPGIALPGGTHPVRLTTLPATRRAGDVRLGAAEIGGRYFGDSVVFRPSLVAAPPRGSISFNLGKRYRWLEVTAGVLDNASDADQVGVFTVVTDGATRKQVTARQGSPQRLRVELHDVLNLRLEAHRPGATAHPVLAGARMAGGLPNNLPELAWGDPIVYP